MRRELPILGTRPAPTVRQVAESLVNGSLAFNPEWPTLGLIDKFKGWEYEREWRVLSVSKELKADHDWPVRTPTRVFVGSKMEMANKQAFRAICENLW